MNTKRNLLQVCLLGSALLLVFTSQAQPTVAKIAAGGYHSMFLKSDGSLWAMGDNTYGQLGDGTSNSSARPEMIVASNVTAIAAGFYHSLFLRSDGSLWAMGDNVDGELGDGTTNSTGLPEMVVASNVTAIAAGGKHSLFIMTDGSLWATGYNASGQLGDGTTDNGNFYVTHPEQIVASGVTAIAAGGSHSLFIKKHGGIGHTTTELWAMGDETYGQLGNGVGCVLVSEFIGYGFTNISTNVPVMILSYTAPAVGSFVTAIAAGDEHSLFLKSDGSLWATGDDDYGQLGDGISPVLFSEAGTNTPEQIRASDVTAIAAGGLHSLFLNSDGSSWAMGDDYYGQLGDGTTNSINLPEMIIATNVTALAAGYDHSLFLESDGSLRAMGDDDYGQLGDGTTNSDGIPFPQLIFTGAPPPLDISIYGGQPAVFFTTATGTNFVLQMTTNLESPNWVAVTNGIPISGVQITNAPGTLFFRLH